MPHSVLLRTVQIIKIQMNAKETIQFIDTSLLEMIEENHVITGNK